MQETRKLFSLIGRNTKTYFKDKMLFFTSMITPLILLFLFFTFLRNVYIDSFTQAFPEGFSVDNKIINGIAGAWLLSSVLSVSSVTVAFCANMVMVDDKIHSSINDFRVAPVKATTISLSYLISNIFVVTLVMIGVLVLGYTYLAIVGWYISASDFFMILLGCLCNIMFGCLLSSIVLSFVKTQGMQSAIATLISALYGFISGAYMPISSFSKGLANFLGLLPGTYGTSIMRNHCMNGYLSGMSSVGLPDSAVEAIRDAFDANISVFGNNISLPAMYGIFLGTSAVLLVILIVLVFFKDKISFKFIKKRKIVKEDDKNTQE
ncbi:MAG: ABC transporter permease [Clostridia bacterium]|nr:ABC transporter permease [Clostridia bacterium]